MNEQVVATEVSKNREMPFDSSKSGGFSKNKGFKQLSTEIAAGVT